MEPSLTQPSGGFCVPVTPGRFKWEHTSWIADSIGDRGRKGELAGIWPGTRSERANLPAIRRERTLLLTFCDNKRRILL